MTKNRAGATDPTFDVQETDNLVKVTFFCEIPSRYVTNLKKKKSHQYLKIEKSDYLFTRGGKLKVRLFRILVALLLLSVGGGLNYYLSTLLRDLNGSSSDMIMFNVLALVVTVPIISKIWKPVFRLVKKLHYLFGTTEFDVIFEFDKKNQTLRNYISQTLFEIDGVWSGFYPFTPSLKSKRYSTCPLKEIDRSPCPIDEGSRFLHETDRQIFTYRYGAHQSQLGLSFSSLRSRRISLKETLRDRDPRGDDLPNLALLNRVLDSVRAASTQAVTQPDFVEVAETRTLIVSKPSASKPPRSDEPDGSFNPMD